MESLKNSLKRKQKTMMKVKKPEKTHAQNRTEKKALGLYHVPDYSIVGVKPEYKEFVIWSAVFKPLRKPPTQQEFALKIHVDDSTLSMWKRMPQFDQDLAKAMPRELIEKAVTVCHTWLDRLTQHSTPGDIKLVLEWIFKVAKLTPENQTNIYANMTNEQLMNVLVMNLQAPYVPDGVEPEEKE